MIHTVPKRYQLALWATRERRSDDTRALLYFDSLDEAKAELQRRRLEGQYAVGVLFEWHKESLTWELLEMY